MKFSTLPYGAKLFLYTLFFAGVTRIGLMFSFVESPVSQVWSPTGVSIVVLYFLGYRYLPAVFFGAAINYVFIMSSFPVGIILAAGTTLEGFIGVLLLRRTTFDPRLWTFRDIGALVLLAGGVSTLLNAVVSVAAVGIFRPEMLDSYLLYVMLWWLGNFVGVIVVTPMLFAMIVHRFESMNRKKIAEFLVIVLAVYGVSQAVFHGAFFKEQLNYSLAFVLFPFAVIATMRFGLIGAVVNTYIVSLNATLSTQTGLGLFAAESYVTSIILLDMFVIVIGSTSLALAALIEERTTAEHSLRRSEESYRIITEQTGQLIYDYNVVTGSINWSGAISNVTGYSAEEFSSIGIAQWAEMIHPDDRERAEKLLDQAMKNREEYKVEYRFRKKNGIYFQVLDRGIFLYKQKSGSSAYRMLGTMADITETKAAEAKLRDSEIRYRLFSLLASDYVYSSSLTPEGFVTEWASPTFERLTGYSLDEVNTNGWNGIIHPDDLSRTIRETEQLAEKKPVIVEYRIVTKSGETKWIRDYMQPMPESSSDRSLKIIGGVQDITLQKKAETELVEKEERFRMLIEKSADGIILMSNRGIIEYASPAATQIIGYESDQLTGKSVFSILHPTEAKENVFKFGRLVLENERSEYLLGRFKHKNGEWVHIEGMVTNLLQNPNIKALVANFRNVSGRIKAEDRLRRSLEEKDILLKEVHHRVKNNMQVISSLLNLHSGKLKDDATAALFRESQNRVKSMALVHEILYQSRDIASVNFSSYVKQLIASLQKSYGAKSSEIAIGVSISAITLDIDAAIPCGLIVNELVSNSIKYAFPKKRKGKIVVTLKKKKTSLELRVADNGIGIPKKQIERSGKVSSLGLQLVHALTEQLKGTITISNAKGTSVTVTFPLRQSTAL